MVRRQYNCDDQLGFQRNGSGRITYTGTVPGFVNFMMGSTVWRRMQLAILVHKAKRDATFHDPVSEWQKCLKLFGRGPNRKAESNGAPSYLISCPLSMHLHGSGCAKTEMWGVDWQGSRRDGGTVCWRKHGTAATGDSSNPRPPAPQLPSFINLEAIHHDDISRQHHRHQAIGFPPSDTWNHLGSIPIRTFSSSRLSFTHPTDGTTPRLGLFKLPNKRRHRIETPLQLAGQFSRRPRPP